ncbi:MAG: hypothetical protein H7318_10735 [Oligoflexus sp.]|nr:hypothetical protein [Oligoflexus sp.]
MLHKSKGMLSLSLILTTALQASPFQGQYGGRLVTANGRPIFGPTDVIVNCYPSKDGGTSLGSQTLASVGLQDSVFSLTITLTDAQFYAVFSAADRGIEINDNTNESIYPGQRFSAVPYAFKIPIDNLTQGGSIPDIHNDQKELRSRLLV